MKIKFLSVSLLAIFFFATLPTITEARTTIKIDGSSTVYPITEAVAEEFQIAKKGEVQVTVGISGTGGGFKKFCRGETDISDASRPIKDSEQEACKAQNIEYVELPVAYDAITVVVHNDNPLNSIKISDLKKMWGPEAQNTITTWKQVNPTFHDEPLKLFGPGSDSGTFDYFTEAVVGKSASSRGDYTASEDDNVLVQGVSTDKNAIGYFGYAYYETNQDRLKALAVDAGNGAVAATLTTVKDNSYPLSRPIFIYVRKDSLQKPEVKEFVAFYLGNASQLVSQVKYIPLSTLAYDLALKRFEQQKTGTMYANKEGTRNVEEILKRDLQ